MKQERYLGIFGVRGNPHHTGELIIADSDTRLKFLGSGLRDLETATNIYGRTENNKKVSCFDCFVTSGPAPFLVSDDHFERVEMLPNFTLIGDEYLEPDMQVIHEVKFKLNDTELLFQDKNSFGSISNVKEELQVIFDTKLPKLKKIARSNSLISYFCGDFNLVSLESDLGNFSAYYNFSADSGRPFEHNVSLSLKFKQPLDFYCSLQRIATILRFFTMFTGRSQHYLYVELIVGRATGEVESKRTPLRVHFARTAPAPRSLTPRNFADAPVNPIVAKEKFANLMQAWIAMDNARYLSRRQYVECVEKDSHYTTTRLVAAANMFDTLPADALPEDVQLPSDFLEAVSETLARFKMLPKTDYRDSLVGHLGRLQKPSLPSKLYHRSKLISSQAQDLFPHLDEVLRIGGQFRNFIVHGGNKFDYKKYELLVPFLTDTLEFVFAASDLIDAGWDFDQWITDDIWGDHQFTKFRRMYPQWIEAFMVAKKLPRTAMMNNGA